MRVWMTAVVLLLTGGVRAEDKESRQTLERAVAALGGAKNLASAGAFTFKVKGMLAVNGEKMEAGGEWSFSGLDRYRWDGEATKDGKTQKGTVAGTAGNAFLVGENGQANDLPGEIGSTMHLSVRALRLAQNPAVLRGKEYTLSTLGELKIEQRETIGIKIAQKGLPDVDVFFDRKTGVPVKCETRIKETKDGMDVAHVYLFDEFKPAGEVKHCTRLKFLRDETTHLDLELSDVKAQEKLDDSLFTKPPKQ